LKIILTTLKKILFWSYDRGTWQYDVLCVLILAFIFLTPNGLFESHWKTRDRNTPVTSGDGTLGIGPASESAAISVSDPVTRAMLLRVPTSPLREARLANLAYASSPVKTPQNGQSKVDQILSKMHATARTIKTYSAKLLQEKRNTQIGGRPQVYRGDLAYRHEPQNRDRGRIKYYDSSGDVYQDLVVDGDKITLYQPRIGQAIITSRKAQAQKNPDFAFIATPYVSVAALKQDYQIVYSRDENVDSVSTAVLDLTPKAHGSITGCSLWVDQSSWLPIKYRATEQRGEITTITFSGVQVNPSLPRDAFKLDLPKGTKLINK